MILVVFHTAGINEKIYIYLSLKKKNKFFGAVGWESYCNTNMMYCDSGQAAGWALGVLALGAQAGRAGRACWACRARGRRACVARRRHGRWAARAQARRALELAGARQQAQQQAGRAGGRRADGRQRRAGRAGRTGREQQGRQARGLGARHAAWAPGLALGSALGALGPFSIRFDLFFFLSHQMNTVHCKINFFRKKKLILINFK